MLSYCSVVMTGSAELPCLLLTETSSLYCPFGSVRPSGISTVWLDFSLYNIPPVNFGFLITFCLFQADIGIRRCIINIIHHKMAGSLICKADVNAAPVSVERYSAPFTSGLYASPKSSRFTCCP